MTLRSPLTGEAAMKIRVWFTQYGQSPDTPYRVNRWYETRYARVPGHLLRDPADEPMCISTEHGDTEEPELEP